MLCEAEAEAAAMPCMTELPHCVQDAHSHLPGAKCEAFGRYLEVVAPTLLV